MRFTLLLKLSSIFIVLAGCALSAGAATLLTTGQIVQAGLEVGEGQAPLNDASKELRLATGHADSVIKQAETGAETSWTEFEAAMINARVLAAAMLNGGRADGLVVQPSRNPAVRSAISTLTVELDAFESAAEDRYSAITLDESAGSGADIRFDEAYDAALGAIVEAAATRGAAEDPRSQALAGEARFNVADAHLVLEEILGGDEGEDINAVLDGFAAAANAMGEIGEAHPAAADTARIAIDALDELSRLAQTRLAAMSIRADALESAQRRYNEALDQLDTVASEAEALIAADLSAAMDRMQSQQEMSVLILGAAALGLLAMTALGFWFAREWVVRPVRLTTAIARSLADGAVSQPIETYGRTDEIGSLLGALEDFRLKLAGRHALEAEKSARDITEWERQAALKAVLATFETRVQEVLASVGDEVSRIGDSASRTRETSQSASQDAQKSRSASSSASEAVTTVAAAARQLAGSIAEIGEQSASAASVVRTAVEVSRQTDTQVEDLSRAASRIGEIIGLINQIAEQTNLLALNATIEAARAGEAGKGFAVVASEVKLLAEQTAMATGDIAAQVRSVQASTAAAVCALAEIGEAVARVDQISSAIAGAVEEQSAVTREISQSIGKAADGARASTDLASGVSASISTVIEQADDVSRRSATLASVRSALDAAVRDFIVAVSGDLAERRADPRIAGRIATILLENGWADVFCIEATADGLRVAFTPALAQAQRCRVRTPDGRERPAIVSLSTTDQIELRFEAGSAAQAA